ncbi:MAG: hypothetical protein WC365_06740 [Candidatus Babeliales bacterium]
MQIRSFRFLYTTLAMIVLIQSNLGAMNTPPLHITPEEKEKIETFIKENSKFSERTKEAVLESKKSSIKPAYWIAGGIAVVLATILITAAYDEKDGKFAARNMLKLLRYFSKAQSNALELEIPPVAKKAAPQPDGDNAAHPKPTDQQNFQGQDNTHYWGERN